MTDPALVEAIHQFYHIKTLPSESKLMVQGDSANVEQFCKDLSKIFKKKIQVEPPPQSISPLLRPRIGVICNENLPDIVPYITAKLLSHEVDFLRNFGSTAVDICIVFYKQQRTIGNVFSWKEVLWHCRRELQVIARESERRGLEPIPCPDNSRSCFEELGVSSIHFMEFIERNMVFPSCHSNNVSVEIIAAYIQSLHVDRNSV
eukprot:TRINITY_DN13657_c0_g1_i5.p1 TRINITY_DN13657_c0_g1~~TRINITY_DN13657_c0_g1_i5.p1  ORF type:complete len:204 (-),score=13.28 TRINITY_DN13657_c0_g1_i5:59-670(-)